MNHLYFVRHTAVDIAPGICYGQSDVPLNHTFETSWPRIAHELADIPFAKTYCSPLSRCRLLAEKLVQPETITTDKRLMELDFGLWELKHWDDIEKEPCSKKWFNNWEHEPCPGGESPAQMRARVAACLAEISRNHHNSNLLIVTHGGVIKIASNLILAEPASKTFEREVEFGEIVKLWIQ